MLSSTQTPMSQSLFQTTAGSLTSGKLNFRTNCAPSIPSVGNRVAVVNPTTVISHNTKLRVGTVKAFIPTHQGTKNFSMKMEITSNKIVIPSLKNQLKFGGNSS